MDMEDEVEILSDSEESEPFDSSDEFIVDRHEDDEEDDLQDDAVYENQPSAENPQLPPSEDRKSKNVDALVRYVLYSSLFWSLLNLFSLFEHFPYLDAKT